MMDITFAEQLTRLRAMLVGLEAADPDRVDPDLGPWRDDSNDPSRGQDDVGLLAAGSKVVASPVGWIVAHRDVIALGLEWSDNDEGPVYDTDAGSYGDWEAVQFFTGLAWRETLALFDEDDVDDHDEIGFYLSFVRADDEKHDGQPREKYLARLRRAIQLSELAAATRTTTTLSSRP